LRELRLMDCARILRSKNAGAFVLTIDVIFKSQQIYDEITAGSVLNQKIIATLYKVREQDVSIIAYPQVLAIKVTMPRLVGSGDIEDADVYGSQQHVPLMHLKVQTSFDAAGSPDRTQEPLTSMRATVGWNNPLTGDSCL